ncbi:family 43 glycosylhydrolase [Paenibacillus arenilitoris]|uniref:Family 43 glycosylhydrolase n=1 Tax=Paenibacillus arenilitoris TaxID=2772299 RepID=A0A927CMA5_9BACL|nr:family 43 glycosylhydrolase [Paenibacillus arenilitoris]MBD2868451.1 family 43 glycosylhydrolase [Paenibacillus arenilitoris]
MKKAARGNFGLKKAAVALAAASVMLTAGACRPEPDEIEVILLEEDAKVYTNSFKLEQEWEDYGIGDPFIMRHNGRYYLYCSTKDWRPGIKAWSSDNLVDWQYEGLVTEDPISTGAYAPEVFYWNGSFYLYTSPAGQGHYVLQSDSPTGPFEVKTGNLGNSIDGSVFIDDDGKWYFTNAGTQGIVAHEMPDPLTIDIGVTTNAFLSHWTEGSMIWKRNGLYYMTYTGNHVFSNGYRVNYAVSKDGPFGDYAIPANNPVILNVDEEFKGLGHSSTVLGPDMDSYYMTYHNLVGRSVEGPPVRELNIDRLAYNGDKLVVLGPTHDHNQPAPAMPALYGRLSDGVDPKEWEQSDHALLSIAPTAAAFIAEYNLRYPEGEKPDAATAVSAVFGYRDDGNYSAVRLRPASHKLELIERKDGAETAIADATLPEQFDYAKLHAIRVERRDSSVLVFFDGMKKLEAETSGAAGGRIGYIAGGASPVYEYTAFANDADGSSDFEAYKPLPGTIEAVHYLKEAERGFHMEQPSADGAAYRVNDGVPIARTVAGSYSVSLQNEGDWLKYKVNAKTEGDYGIGVALRKPDDDVVLEWSVDGGKAEKTTIRADDPAFAEAGWAKVRAGTLKMPAGFHELKVKLAKGASELESFELFELAEKSAKAISLDEASIRNKFGLFSESDEGGGYSGSGIDDDRLFLGDDRWDDYEFAVQVKLESDTDAGGLFVRETNESYHPDQVMDAAMGYYIGVTSSQVTLSRLNYDSILLASETAQFEPGEEHPIKVVAQGGRIRVYVNGEKDALIDYTDPNPFLYGKVGIRSERSSVSFHQMTVKPLPGDR